MRCCNPECEAPFNYREGRLIRLSKTSPHGKPAGNQASIKHFWLCKECAPLYAFEYDSAMNVKIKRKEEEPSEKKRLVRSVSAA